MWGAGKSALCPCFFETASDKVAVIGPGGKWRSWTTISPNGTRTNTASIRKVVDAILDAVDAGDAATIDELMEPLHAADIADLLEQIGSAERAGLLKLWSRGIDGEILSELDESIREEVIAALPHEVLTEAVRELDSDDVVDLIEDLEEPVSRNASSARSRIATGSRSSNR